MTNNNQITVVQQELHPLITESSALAIVSNGDLSRATAILSQMNKIIDRVTKEKERITRPLLDALAVERGRWKPIENAYNNAIEPLRAKISVYQTLQVSRQAEAAKKLAKDLARGNVSFDEASQALQETQAVEKVKTDEGTLAFRATATLKVTNKSLIPDNYWVMDEAELLKDLKDGKSIPGVRLEIIQVPVNRRT